MLDKQSKVGVAIATFNSGEHLRECLEALRECDHARLYVVVVDDQSVDGTWAMLEEDFPEVVRIRGNGDLWWTGGTNKAIQACLEAECDFVLLLNPDVIVELDTISQLLVLSTQFPDTICAPVVVRHDSPQVVWWAGSRWLPAIRILPLIWASRYIVKPRSLVESLPSRPYLTSEAHGRSVLVSAKIFRHIGLYDNEYLPHYGADVEFSFRARHAGYKILVNPETRVRLHQKNTGMKIPDTLKDALRGYWNYLTQRKNGEAVRIWWHIIRRHLPWYSVIPTYLAILGWNSYRYWSRVYCYHFLREDA